MHQVLKAVLLRVFVQCTMHCNVLALELELAHALHMQMTKCSHSGARSTRSSLARATPADGSPSSPCFRLRLRQKFVKIEVSAVFGRLSTCVCWVRIGFRGCGRNVLPSLPKVCDQQTHSLQRPFRCLDDLYIVSVWADPDLDPKTNLDMLQKRSLIMIRKIKLIWICCKRSLIQKLI